MLHLEESIDWHTPLMSSTNSGFIGKWKAKNSFKKKNEKINNKIKKYL